MSADVSQSESHPLLLGPPVSGQGETQCGARLRDNDGASFSTSSTAFAEATGTSHGGQDDHHGHDTQPLKASKPPKLDAPRDSHEHISKDLAAPRRQFHVLSFWMLEILSLALAACLLSTIAVVLMRLDGEPVATPQWPLGINININTLVALLATFIRACILIVAAAILGQTRWLWYQGPKPRALQDLQDFDSGSRGVAGSLGLLRTVLRSGAGPTTAGTLGMLGAVVTVLSLGVGTFVQQAVNTVNCPQLMPGQKASLPIAYRVKTNGFNKWHDYYGFAPDLKAAMINGLSSQLADLAPGIATHCPTGNCTFINQPTASGANQTHASIALCSRCTDSTKFVKIQKETSYFWSTSSGAGELIDAYMNTLRITFPGLNGSIHPLMTPDLQFSWMIVGLGDLPTSDGNHSEPLMPPDIAAVSLGNVSILAFTRAPCKRSDSGQEWECPRNISLDLVSETHDGTHDGYDVLAQPRNQVDILAATCSLYPCLKNYWAEVQSGTLNETVVSTVPVMAQSNWTLPYSIDQNPCQEDFPGKCHYEVDYDYGGSMTDYMRTDLLDGVTECASMVSSSNATGFDPNPMKMVYCGQSGEKWWLTPLWNEGNATLRSVSDTMDNLTNAVTNHWRATGDGPVRADDGSVVYNRSGAVVYGQVWQTTVCLKFEWQWLLLPAGLLAVVASMLVMVVTSSYQDQPWPVWKENILPMVLYGGISDHQAGRDGPTGERPGDGDGDGRRDLTDLNSLKAEAKETMVVFRRQPSPAFVVAAGN